MRLQHLPYLEYAHKFDTPVNINPPSIKDYWRIYKQYPWKLFDSVFTTGLRLLRNVLKMVLPFIVSALVVKYGGSLLILGLKKLNEQYPLSWIDDFISYLTNHAGVILLLIWIVLIFIIAMILLVDYEGSSGRVPFFYKDIWTPPVMILWEKNKSGFMSHVYEYPMYNFEISNKSSWEKYHGLTYEHRLIQHMIFTPSGTTLIEADPENHNFLEMYVVATKRHNGLSMYAERLNVITEETDYGTFTWNLGNGTDDLPKKRNLKLGINH